MITIEMARCLAKISGDGYLYYRYIRYNNTCPELIEEFVKDINKEFNHSKFTYGITNTRTPFVQIHGKHIISKFLMYLPSFKSGEIYVPEEIFSSSQNIKASYLRALFDDEGSVMIRIFKKTGEWKRNIKIDSKSYKLLKGVKDLLEEFNISTNKICKDQKEDKFWYYLGISGKQNFIKFEKNIGFTSPKKQKKLSLMLKTYRMTYKRNYAQFMLLKEELKELLKPRKAAKMIP